MKDSVDIDLNRYDNQQQSAVRQHLSNIMDSDSYAIKQAIQELNEEQIIEAFDSLPEQQRLEMWVAMIKDDISYAENAFDSDSVREAMLTAIHDNLELAYQKWCPELKSCLIEVYKENEKDAY